MRRLLCWEVERLDRKEKLWELCHFTGEQYRQLFSSKWKVNIHLSLFLSNCSKEAKRALSFQSRRVQTIFFSKWKGNRNDSKWKIWKLYSYQEESKRQIAKPSFTMLTILIDITIQTNLLLLLWTCTRCRAVAPRLPNPIFERFRQLWSVAPSFTRRHRSPLIILHHIPILSSSSSSSGDRMMMTMFILRSFHYKLLSDSQQGQSKLGCGNIGKVEIGTWETAVLRLEAMCYFFIIELKDK